MTQSQQFSIKKPFAPNQVPSQNKIKALQPSYSNLKQLAIRSDGAIFNNQSVTFETLNTLICKLQQRVEGQIQKTSTNINTIKNSAHQLDLKIKDYEDSIGKEKSNHQAMKKLSNLKDQYVKVSGQRIKLVDTIDIKKFLSLYLDDRKSMANEPFKWCMVAFYGQPQSKYYWPNFSEQAFSNDNGLDFKQRLSKVSAFKAKQQQKLKTDSFITNFDKVIQSKQLKSAKDQIAKLKEVAVLFGKSFDIGKEIHHIQNDEVKRKEKIIQKDQQFEKQKAKAEAFRERILFNEQYLKIMLKFKETFKNKQASYASQRNKIQQMMKVLTDAMSWQPVININRDVSSGCLCSF